MDEEYISKHSWGDPREPEYNDGMQVFFVEYADQQRSLRFRVNPFRNDDQKINWVIYPPKSIGKSFGGKKQKYLEVCNFILEFLKKI
ncbi:hypothetical protein GCM10011613_35890 [Cellvibrio zantedeschiae]|uniref:Uncharacterized protein n=1 Tax=Cellvibrio zantedeschiae TaxID=1237077 RepID=A0ABQ3BBW7_9GAMM|nr:hypothetical protein [Cellvibrio zantedeschiae]GGY87513.1 hypothetical protein GCM10011613_35890 [Cellvibrio zantedeschiae]